MGTDDYANITIAPLTLQVCEQTRGDLGYWDIVNTTPSYVAPRFGSTGHYRQRCSLRGHQHHDHPRYAEERAKVIRSRMAAVSVGYRGRHLAALPQHLICLIAT